MYFLGWAVACVFFSRIADIFGRKNFFSYSLLIQFVLYAGIVYINNLYVVIVLFFFFGVCLFGRYTTGFILMMEYSPFKYQPILGSFFGFM
jgi:MFS family permease